MKLRRRSPSPGFAGVFAPACAMLAGFAAGPPAAGAQVPGDVNGDGSVSATDAALVRLYLVGVTSLSSGQLAGADSNLDGGVDIADFTMILTLPGVGPTPTPTVSPTPTPSPTPGNRVELLGVVNGDCWSVAARDGFAYLGVAGGFKIVDAADPRNPDTVGQLSNMVHPSDIALSGSLAFVADFNAGLHIVDVSNPASPRLAGSHRTPGIAEAVAVAGTIAHVSCGSAGLLALDVSNPAAPAQLGLAETPGYALSTAVAGSIAFVADYDAVLQTYDISNPAAPVRLGGLDTGDFGEGVAAAGGFAYVAARYSGLQIMDVTNLASPVMAANFFTGGNSRAIALDGALAFVAHDPYELPGNLPGGVAVIDVANPAAPATLGSYPASRARDVAAADGLIFLANPNEGLMILRYTGSRP